VVEVEMLESGVYEKGRVDVSILVKKFMEEEKPEDIGAMATFLGVTRRRGLEGREVDRVEIQSYEEHANRVIRKICREVEEKYGVSKVLIYHLTGEFKVGEPLVLVVVAGKMRSQVFPALEEAVRRYKTEPALWKREVYVDGTSRWISHA